MSRLCAVALACAAVAAEGAQWSAQAASCAAAMPYESHDPGSIRWARLEDFDGRVPFCRGFYLSVRYEPFGGGWATDGPQAECNFQRRLGELTDVDPGDPLVVRLSDPLLHRCPFVFMSDVGTFGADEGEAAGLRRYLATGGLLWVDDFWGTKAWEHWVDWLDRLAPGGAIVDLDADHPIRRTLYHIPVVPQVPNIGLWRTGETSEQGEDSAEVHFRGLVNPDGRLLVVMTHNTDIADTFEEEGSEPQSFFDTFAAAGYGLGVNIVLYALTH